MMILGVCLAFGVLVGLCAGLLGIGGGAILVPILDFVFPMANINEDISHHMALGTSLASIMFTSFSSARAHNAYGTIPWDVVKKMTPGLLLGTFGGSAIASYIPALPLKLLFVVFLTYTALQMLLNFKPKATFNLPGSLGLILAGGFIGLMSSFVGIGGGSLIIPFLTICNVPIISAISASAAMGFPIALAGAVGYGFSGWGLPELPPYALGHVYLPALGGVVVTSMIFAPLGAKLSHRLPVATLKRCFGVLLLIVAGRMLYTTLM